MNLIDSNISQSPGVDWWALPAKFKEGLSNRTPWFINLTAIARNGKALEETFAKGGNLFQYTGSFSTALTVSNVAAAVHLTVGGVLGSINNVRASIKAYTEGDFRTLALHTFVYLPQSIGLASLGFGIVAIKVTFVARIALAHTVALGMMAGGRVLFTVFFFVKALYQVCETDDLSTKIKGLEADFVNLGDKELQSTGEKLSSKELKKLNFMQNLIVDQTARNKLERQTSKEFVEKRKKALEANNTPTAEQVRSLFDEMKKTNYLATIQARILCVRAIIGCLSLGAGMLFTGGLPTLLSMIGSMVTLNIDSPALWEKVGDWFWEHHNQQQKSTTLDEAKFRIATVASILSLPIWIFPALIIYEGKAAFKGMSEALSAERATEKLEGDGFH